VRLGAMWAGVWPRPGWSGHSRSWRAGCGRAGVWSSVCRPEIQLRPPPLKCSMESPGEGRGGGHGLAGGVPHGGSGGWSARRLRGFFELRARWVLGRPRGVARGRRRHGCGDGVGSPARAGRGGARERRAWVVFKRNRLPLLGRRAKFATRRLGGAWRSPARRHGRRRARRPRAAYERVRGCGSFTQRRSWRPSWCPPLGDRVRGLPGHGKAGATRAPWKAASRADINERGVEGAVLCPVGRARVLGCTWAQRRRGPHGPVRERERGHGVASRSRAHDAAYNDDTDKRAS
jgi:hypothetical protein